MFHCVYRISEEGRSSLMYIGLVRREGTSRYTQELKNVL